MKFLSPALLALSVAFQSVKDACGSQEYVRKTSRKLENSETPGPPTVSPAPVGAVCPGQNELKITLNLDGYASETSWALSNECDGTQVASDSYEDSDNNSEIVVETCVPSASYSWVISDSYGDGMCCDYGQGSYSVEYEGNVVGTGGEFSNSDTVTFGVCPPTPSPTPGPPTVSPTTVGAVCPGQNELKITLNLDDYANETSWALSNECAGTQVASDSYEDSDNNSEIIVETCVPSASYSWVISDSYGDGMCCDYGQGSYSVEYEGNVVGTGGEFGSSDTVTFGVCGTDELCLDDDVPVNVNILFDKYPTESSWTLVNECTDEVVESGNRYSDSDQLDVTKCVPRARYTFTILDSEGDGLCCKFGEGSYKVNYDAVEVAVGGEFKENDSVSFGECQIDLGEEEKFR